MRSEWRKVALGEITELVIDYRGKTPKKLGGDWSDSGYRALSAKNIKTGQIVHHDAIRYVDETMYRKWMKDEIQRGDIIVTSEAPFGQIYYWDSDEKIVLSQRLFGLRIKKEYDPQYVYYYMTTDAFQGEMSGRATGTTVIGLRQPELMKCELYCPDRQTQKSIAAVLAAIDDKIELNEKINDNLQQQVYALFDAWFVSFIQTNGEMPADWHEGTLGDIATITSGKRPPMKQTAASADVTIPLVGAASIMGFTNAVLYNEPILVTGRVGTHGIIQRFQSPCWTSDNTLVIKSDFYEYTFQVLQRVDYANMNRGSTQPLITQTDLKNVSIIIPTKEALLEYEKIAGSLMVMYESNRKENERLEALRDALLPRLMSGEIDVTNIEI